MKIEIEVTEQELRHVLERKVHAAITDLNTDWEASSTIKQRTKEMWNATVETLLTELLGSNEELKTMVAAEVEKRIRARINAALKNT